MTNKLLGCAFCGGGARAHESQFTPGYRWIKCGNCGFTLDGFNASIRCDGWLALSAEQLAARWNKLHQIAKEKAQPSAGAPLQFAANQVAEN